MDSNLVARADAVVGDRIEALVRAHHRRRLARTGLGRAFEPSPRLWADGDPPPRRGNDVEILIDGASFLPRLAEELERAESHVHVAGWYLSTELALVREGDRRVLLDLLAELARKIEVRVLLWAGAPLPLFRRLPDSRDVRPRLTRRRAGGLSREPVPLVSRARRDPRREAEGAAAGRLSHRRRAAFASRQRQRRQPRPGRRAGRRRRRRG